MTGATEHKGERAGDTPREYAEVVALVRALGDTAVSRFLDGLSPHLTAIAEHRAGAAKALACYLHEVDVSAKVLIAMGGHKGAAAAGNAARHADSLTADEAVSRLKTLLHQ